MMQVSEINEIQLMWLKQSIHHGISPTYLVPDIDKDDATSFVDLTRSLRDAEYLVNVGLFQEVSEQEKATLEALKTKLNRDFRSFRPTDIARRMFSKEATAAIN